VFSRISVAIIIFSAFKGNCRKDWFGSGKWMDGWEGKSQMGWLMRGMDMEWKWEFDMDIDTQWHVVYWRDYGWHCHSRVEKAGDCVTLSL
jgi:hypothetical protein